MLPLRHEALPLCALEVQAVTSRKTKNVSTLGYGLHEPDLRSKHRCPPATRTTSDIRSESSRAMLRRLTNRKSCVPGPALPFSPVLATDPVAPLRAPRSAPDQAVLDPRPDTLSRPHIAHAARCLGGVLHPAPRPLSRPNIGHAVRRLGGVQVSKSVLDTFFTNCNVKKCLRHFNGRPLCVDAISLPTVVSKSVLERCLLLA